MTEAMLADSRGLVTRFLVAICLFFSPVALAQAPVNKQEAVSMIEAGNVAYEEQDYERALIHYKRAFRAAPDARILYRIGLTYEHLGNFQRAREHFELYLQQDPSSPNIEQIGRKIEELRLAEVNQSFLVIRATEKGEVYLDEFEASGVTPVRLPVHPGVHLIRVKFGKDWAERQVMIGRAETVTEVFEVSAPSEEKERPKIEPEVIQKESPSEAVAPITMTRVSFKPPVVLNALGWVGVIGGFWLGVMGVVLGDGIAIAGGLASLGLGGYAIFIHDWSNQLPDAPLRPEGARSVEFLIRF